MPSFLEVDPASLADPDVFLENTDLDATTRPAGVPLTALDTGSGTPLRLRTVGAEGLPTFLASDGRILAGPAVGLTAKADVPRGRSRILFKRTLRRSMCISPRAPPRSGCELRGSAAVLVSAVIAIGEGPCPELLLAPGEAHYFSFNVVREGPVGIGVRAAPDTATCRLLDTAGRTIGEGIVQMPKLAPGTYLLAVRAPADGGPVTVRPAPAGIVPPKDVLRRYLRLSRGEPENEGPAAPASAPQTSGPEDGD